MALRETLQLGWLKKIDFLETFIYIYIHEWQIISKSQQWKKESWICKLKNYNKEQNEKINNESFK